MDKTGGDPRATARVVTPPRLSQDGTTPGEHIAQGDCQDHPLHQKIARIKLIHSRPTEWAPTTDKDELHPDGAKIQC